MLNIKMGEHLHDLLRLCRTARSPLLFTGRHGIGKSEFFEEHAAAENIGCIVRDLSLMEPVDLVGLPQIEGGRTVFRPPSFLPSDGQGLLVFEELNRAPRHVQTPCLELCTRRRLNDYHLPTGWLIVAAVNPSGGDYDVDELDPALLNRFIQIGLEADRDGWLEWAKENEVHPDVVEYVGSDLTVFSEPDSNPRAWKHVSDLLQASTKLKTPDHLLQAAVAGKVSPERAAAFQCFRKTRGKPLTAREVIDAYGAHRAAVRSWGKKEGHLDLVRGTLLAVQKHLQSAHAFEAVQNDPAAWKNLSRFLLDLPGDLKQQARKFFEEREYEFPSKENIA